MGKRKPSYIVFKNGYGVSVLFGKNFYSNGKNTYEVAIIKGNEQDFNLVYDTPIANDVIGNITEEQVTRVMKLVQKLNKNKVYTRDFKAEAFIENVVMTAPYVKTEA
nr:MAG TPA: hypothetical protein [Caudoviricetes sp.]